MGDEEYGTVPGFGSAGSILYEAIYAALREKDLDAIETEFLNRACTSADHIARLEDVIAAEGVTTTGSRGQTVIHPALSELRQQKQTLLRLLQAIDLGGDEPADETPRSAQARRAAEARWTRRDWIELRRAATRARPVPARATYSDSEGYSGKG